MPIVPGTTVGPYQILEQLGAGGMATVYKAYHPALDRDVAIKVLHPAFKNEPQFFARFQREARIVAKLEHPNIVPVYDFNEFDGEPYLVMRFVKGKTLKAFMADAPFDAARVLEIMEPVCDALAYAHRQGILHRDIKPSNIILADDGHVFLTDFGLARMAELGESTLSQDMLVGTPQYISPEQAQGQGNIDQRTDIYALGVVLFEMLTGSVPYSADTPFAVIHDHIYKPLPLPTTLNPNLNPAIEKVILKALAKSPDDRFFSIEKLWDALQAAVPAPVNSAAENPAQSETVVRANAAAPATVVEKPPKKKRSKKKIALITAGILISLILCVALFSSGGGEKARPADVPQVDAPAGQASDSLPPQGESPRVEQLVNEGINRLKADDAGAAADIFLQAIEQDPHYLPAYMYGAITGLRVDDPGMSRMFIEQAVMNNAARPEAHALAGYIYTRLGDMPIAEEEYQRAVDINPENPIGYVGLARVALLNDDLDAATDFLNQAKERGPESPELRMVDAELLLKKGQRRAALLELRKIAGEKGLSPLVRDELRFVFDAIGEPPPPALNP